MVVLVVPRMMQLKRDETKVPVSCSTPHIPIVLEYDISDVKMTVDAERTNQHPTGRQLKNDMVLNRRESQLQVSPVSPCHKDKPPLQVVGGCHTSDYSDLTALDDSGYSKLHHIIINSQWTLLLQIISYFKQSPAKRNSEEVLNVRSRATGDTPLHLVCQLTYDTYLVKSLIEGW